MTEKFEALALDKRQRIIEAALDEFSAKGYEKGNTNEIVKKAGISKGLLFHYFGSKKRLFLYVAECALKAVREGMQGDLGSMPGDIVEMIAEITAMKMRMAAVYPREYRILVDAYINTPDELKPDIGKEYASVLREQKEKFVAMMDTGKLREGVTPEQAYDLITACAQGIFSPFVNGYEKRTLEETMEWVKMYRKQMLDILSLLKHGIYKQDHPAD